MDKKIFPQLMPILAIVSSILTLILTIFLNWEEVKNKFDVFNDGGYLTLSTKYKWTLPENERHGKHLFKTSDTQNDEPPIILLVKGNKNIGKLKLSYPVDGAFKGYINKSDCDLANLSDKIYASNTEKLVVEGLDFKNSENQKGQIVMVIDEYEKNKDKASLIPSVSANNRLLRELKVFTEKEFFETTARYMLITSFALVALLLFIFDIYKKKGKGKYTSKPSQIIPVNHPKRFFPRYSIEETILFKVGNKDCKGTIMNLSIGGMFISKCERFGKKSILTLCLKNNNSEEKEIEAKIVYRNSNGIGVCYL